MEKIDCLCTKMHSYSYCQYARIVLLQKYVAMWLYCKSNRYFGLLELKFSLLALRYTTLIDSCLTFMLTHLMLVKLKQRYIEYKHSYLAMDLHKIKILGLGR